MEWSGSAWVASVVAVIVSGTVAAYEGHWRKRPGLDLGFADHGGMWGDLLLLPVVNAVTVPWVEPGWWLLGPLGLAAVVSLVLHGWWHGGTPEGVRDHMWPSRPSGRWTMDLSLSGWCHVAYVAGELGLLLAWALSPAPPAVVWVVAILLSLHAPLGVLQPAWLATGRLPAVDVRLVMLALGAAWVVAAAKL